MWALLAFGFEEKWVWLALIQFGEELNLNRILVEFWPMLLPRGCSALVESRAVKLCVGIHFACQGLETLGCCPALGESRAVVSWCAFCPCVLGAGRAKLCARPSSLPLLP